jgi:hypothetical protein
LNKLRVWVGENVEYVINEWYEKLL